MAYKRACYLCVSGPLDFCLVIKVLQLESVLERSLEDSAVVD